MPFRSQQQWRWAFATGQPFADRWAKETPGGKGRRFRRLPRKRKKSYTLAQLEAWCNSPCYDPRIAQAIASRVPEQRQAERQQAKDKNRAATLASLNIAPDGQAARNETRAQKAQTDEEKAMFAKMGGGGSGGSGGSGGGAWKRGADGKRVPPYKSTMDRGHAALQRKNNRNDSDLREALAQASGSHDKVHLITQSLNKGTGQGGHALDPRSRKNYEEQRRQYQKKEDAALRKVYRLSQQSEPATAKSFRVFKDSQGAWRWVAQSSTAYRDRDGEIVSTKALADDVTYADHTGQYGPLRWWHTPGLDLGDCDFNALIGRVLVESGTFRSASIAQKIARYAADLEISLGFFHPPTEPDRDGVFHHIRRFERSLTPRGKASNLFTNFQVKEQRMLDDTKKAALKALGFDDADITDLESHAAQTQKSADDQGVAYKADEPAETEEITLNGKTYVLKAAPPMMADEETPAEDMAEGGMEEPEDMLAEDGGLTLSPEDLQAIGQAVGAALSSALAPLVGAMDMTNKMGQHMADLKGMLEGYTGAQTKKDATIAELQQAVAQQGAQLAELAGDQPAAGYRPTQARDTVIATQQNTQLIEAVKSQIPQGGPFDDILQGLGLSRPANPLA